MGANMDRWLMITGLALFAGAIVVMAYNLGFREGMQPVTDSQVTQYTITTPPGIFPKIDMEPYIPADGQDYQPLQIVDGPRGPEIRVRGK